MLKFTWWRILLLAFCLALPLALLVGGYRRVVTKWRFEPAGAPDPRLPRVLLIGDSILDGYLGPVTAALKGKANVDAWINPHHHATPNLDAMIADVLSHGPYDVIHFNMGLHGWEKGRIPDGQYEALARRLVEILRKGAPKAALIWASSTPVSVRKRPTQVDPVINPIVMEHNRMAAGVMKQMNVAMDDLYTLMASKLELGRGDQFHWTTPGYETMARQIAASIETALRMSNFCAVMFGPHCVKLRAFGGRAPIDRALNSAGVWYFRLLCGRSALKCRRQFSITTFAMRSARSACPTDWA